MSDPVIWWAEARRCGPAALALPVAAAAAVLAIAVALRGGSAPVGVGMVRLSATIFPLACGLAAASALGRECLVELQVAVATPYALTLARRLVALTACCALGAIALVAGLHGVGLWRHPAAGATGLLVPLGPAIFLVGVAALAGAALRFHAAPLAAAVVGAWVFQVFIWSNYVAQWQVNATLLTLTGLAAGAGGLRLLGDPERLLAAGAR